MNEAKIKQQQNFYKIKILKVERSTVPKRKIVG